MKGNILLPPSQDWILIHQYPFTNDTTQGYLLGSIGDIINEGIKISAMDAHGRLAFLPNPSCVGATKTTPDQGYNYGYSYLAGRSGSPNTDQQKSNGMYGYITGSERIFEQCLYDGLITIHKPFENIPLAGGLLPDAPTYVHGYDFYNYRQAGLTHTDKLYVFLSELAQWVIDSNAIQPVTINVYKKRH